MSEDKNIFSIVGCIIVSFAIVYILISLFKVQKIVVEGLTNSSNSVGSGTTGSSNGISNNASSYASTIKAHVVKLQDELLISKYKTDYENVIINLSDLVEILMLKQTLDIDPSGTPNQLMHSPTDRDWETHL